CLCGSLCLLLFCRIGSSSCFIFFFSSRRRHTRSKRDWSSDVCSSDLEYNAGSITILEGLEAVRKRLGMYIGSTGPRGLHHLIWEVVDNSVYEAMADYESKVIVRLMSDGGV